MRECELLQAEINGFVPSSLPLLSHINLHIFNLPPLSQFSCHKSLKPRCYHEDFTVTIFVDKGCASALAEVPSWIPL